MKRNGELEARLADAREGLRKLAPSYDELLDLAAAIHVSSAEMGKAIEELQQIVKSNSLAFGIASSDKPSEDAKFSLLEYLATESSNKAANVMLAAVSIQKTLQAKNAANRRHAKPGGAKEKSRAILAAWASGKYTSRDICAEQECAALGMSFSSARKALRGTPKPT